MGWTPLLGGGLPWDILEEACSGGGDRHHAVHCMTARHPRDSPGLGCGLSVVTETTCGQSLPQSSRNLRHSQGDTQETISCSLLVFCSFSFSEAHSGQCPTSQVTVTSLLRLAGWEGALPFSPESKSGACGGGRQLWAGVQIPSHTVSLSLSLSHTHTHTHTHAHKHSSVSQDLLPKSVQSSFWRLEVILFA